MTEECNFRCSYCYQQKRNTFLEISTIDKALEFLLPYFAPDCTINFYGGEPLLAWDRIEYTVARLHRLSPGHGKHFRYSISTNGSLLDEDKVRFLDRHHFSVLLSFDGLAQDITKQKGSFSQIISSLKNLCDSPNIDLETNSVFTPETLRYLTESVLLICSKGVKNIGIGFSRLSPWDESSLSSFKTELGRLRDSLSVLFRQTGHIPLVNFRPRFRPRLAAAPFTCTAGKDRLCLTPDENIWGCSLFFDYFKAKKADPAYHRFCFGRLEAFMAAHQNIYPAILSNYSNLRVDKFSTPTNPCNQCEDMHECEVCPADNLFLGSAINRIPSWACRMKRLFIEEKMLFLDEVKKN